MDEHLGGYVAGGRGDEATWFPDLWRWAVDEFDVKSVLDIGCGEGHAVKFFRDELNCHVLGLDGVPQDDPDIWEHDFTLDHPHLPAIYDLVWCCEVVEHIEERFLSNLAQAFQTGRVVMMTHAEPGQQGHHHVNCRDAEYWKGFFAGIGFTYRDDLTRMARLQAAINPSPYNHFTRSGMVFTSTADSSPMKTTMAMQAGFPVGFCKNFSPHAPHVWNAKQGIPTQGLWCPGQP